MRQHTLPILDETDDRLLPELKDFMDRCLQYHSIHRASAQELLAHPFLDHAHNAHLGYMVRRARVERAGKSSTLEKEDSERTSLTGAKSTWFS